MTQTHIAKNTLVDGGARPGDYRELIRCATLAASSHNTQPWRFRLGSSGVEIMPDFTRRCPEVDPDDHHLFVSLGCAAENLLLAALARGLNGHAVYDSSTESIPVLLEPAPAASWPEFEAIPRRQCSRTLYDGTALTAPQVQALEAAGRGDGVSVFFITDAQRREKVIEYVAAGNSAQFADKEWAAEMRHWIRFNRRAARRSGDGLYGKVFGIPDMPTWLGRVLMPVAASAARQNQKDAEHIRSSGAIVVFVSAQDDKRHWVEAGRCYERFALRATSLGLRTAFINQPVEVSSLRAQFASYLMVGERRPDLIVRVGNGPEAPRSLRRPLGDVIIADSASADAAVASTTSLSHQSAAR